MKIFVFGIVASGKTTLANELSKKYNITHYEGDNIAWGFKEERYKRSEEEQHDLISEINKNDWIIDGTLRKEQRELFDLCDVLIFLNTTYYIRIYRIIKRYIRQKLKIERANYRPNLRMVTTMFKWTRDYEKNRHQYENLLLTYNHKLVIIRKKRDFKNLDNTIKNMLYH
jgi:adenylate kinase family enzyme